MSRKPNHCTCQRVFASHLVEYVLVTQPCPTLCNPVDCSLPDFSVHGILQARILKWIAIPFSRGTSQPRDRTLVSCIAGRFFTTPCSITTNKVWKEGREWAQVCGFSPNSLRSRAWDVTLHNPSSRLPQWNCQASWLGRWETGASQNLCTCQLHKPAQSLISIYLHEMVSSQSCCLPIPIPHPEVPAGPWANPRPLWMMSYLPGRIFAFSAPQIS